MPRSTFRGWAVQLDNAGGFGAIGFVICEKVGAEDGAFKGPVGALPCGDLFSTPWAGSDYTGHEQII